MQNKMDNNKELKRLGTMFAKYMRAPLAHENDIYDSYQKIEPYSSQEEILEVLLQVVKKEVLSKKLAKSILLKNAYHLFSGAGFSLPFKQVQAIVEQLGSGNELSAADILQEKLQKEEWEQTKNGAYTFYGPYIWFDKKEQLQAFIEKVVNRFDDFVKLWRYAGMGDFKITDLSTKRHSIDEHGFFSALANIPELEPLVACFVAKVVEENKAEPLLYMGNVFGNSLFLPIGRYAVAVLASYSSKYDDLVLAYLQSLPEAPLQEALSAITRMWYTELNINPELPKTLAAFPSLLKQNYNCPK